MLRACGLVAALFVLALWVGNGRASEEGRETAGNAPDGARHSARADDYGRSLLLGGRQGTLADLKRSGLPNLAQGSLGGEEIRVDALALAGREHFTRLSKSFRLGAGKDYTFVVEAKAGGEGYVSAGIRRRAPDAPPGLVDDDEFVTVIKAPCDWVERSFTFSTPQDSGAAETQVLLKAFGGATAVFRNARVVEGWYADTPVRFQRPWRAGERKW